MKKQSLTVAGVMVLALASTAIWATSKEPTTPQSEPIEVAKFDSDGDLLRPDGIEKWVFLGASLGMGYNEQVAFDPDTPGNFQTVLMEPSAFDVFEETGKFPDGSMFALIFNGTETNVSINQSGFVMGGQLALEIHLKDKKRFPETGFNFYFFGKGAETAPTRPAPNACTNCHMEHAEYDGVFTQFYPTIRDHVAKKE